MSQLTTIMERFVREGPGKAWAQKAAQSDGLMRRAALDEIAAARKAHDDAMPELSKAHRTAVANRTRAYEAYLEARNDEIRALARSDAADALASLPAHRHHHMLLNTAPGVIAAAVVEFRDAMEAVRQRRIHAESELKGRNVDTMQLVYRSKSNRRGIEAVLKALGDAYHAAKELPFQVADDQEALAAIEQLRASIPWSALEELHDTSAA